MIERLRPGLRTRVTIWLGVLALLFTSFVAGVRAENPAQTMVADDLVLTAGQYRSDARGLDRCNAPTDSQMQAFWTGTVWWWWGVYIGGSNMACANTNVTADWIRRQTGEAGTNRAWRLLFIWVAYQPPCTGYAHRFSSNTSTAYDQGYAAANSAFNRAQDLSLNLTNLPLVYDLEPFDHTNTTCLNATKAFVRGWTTFLHLGIAQQSGLYGAVCGSGLDYFATINPNPDFVWGAWNNGNPDTHNLDPSTCQGVASTHWAYNRHKQYTLDVSVTENGVTLAVDKNCSRAPIYGVGDTGIDPACQ